MKNNPQELRYINHAEIDRKKWNQCIDQAGNCRIYAYDWHLDRTTEVWDALVWDDYKYVLPLPIRKKMGITYLFQPLFSQQLGIFPTPSKEIAKQFYNCLIKKFQYSEIQLNSENFELENGIEFVPRKNFLLPLIRDYQLIAAEYSKNTKRNISKANKNNLSLVTGIRLKEYMNFKTNNLAAKVGRKELARLKSVIAFGQYKGFGEIHGVYSGNNELCAAVYFCRWKNRVIYMNAASNNRAKENGAMYFLVDNFIRANAGQNLFLDFEGSMIPGVARFYSGFGAIPETYFQLKFNRLPLPLKWLKR